MSATARPWAPDLSDVAPAEWPATLNEYFRTGLPGLLGIELVSVAPGRSEGRLRLRDDLLQVAGGLVHSGTLITFADSLSGWGCLVSLPDTACAFVTGELKANMVATTRMPDVLTGVGTLLHGGRTTQLWDVTVARESDGRPLAHFRCTQHLLSDAPPR